MRRLAFLFVLVVTAVLIPGKRVKAQAGVASPAVASAAMSAVNSEIAVLSLMKAAIPGSRSHSTARSVGMAIGWLLIVALVGFALMAFGADKLQIVVNTMQEGIGKSLGTGIIGQLVILPGAVAVVVLLAATLVGVLLIPLGLLAFIVAVVGIAMVGFIAVAIMTGAALTGGKKDETPNGAMLRAFLTGTAVYLGLWIVVALLSGIPLVGAMVESFVSAVTFIAVTTGFGAVLLSYWRGEFKKAA
ncbi:MAG TPA: hypothetical protein VFX40_04680 [Gemmatimonadaceae bacterium]|nr:hypothetical protein [Gemmatimonadaceae bacterium]